MSITKDPEEMQAFGRWKGLGSYTDRERKAFEAGYAAMKGQRDLAIAAFDGQIEKVKRLQAKVTLLTRELDALQDKPVKPKVVSESDAIRLDQIAKFK